MNDKTKRDAFTSLGYKVIEIPYFVQLSRDVIKHMFNIDLDIEQTYPHGFIDKDAMLPLDFCCLGIERFESDLETFGFIKEDILSSLRTKLKEKVKVIIPEPLKHLL